MYKTNILLATLFMAISSMSSADPQKVFEKAINDLRKSEMMSDVLRTGSKAPDFKLFDQKREVDSFERNFARRSRGIDIL